MKIVVCEKCYDIPKIAILNNGKIKIECGNCQVSEIKEYHYFDKFIKNNNDDKLFDLGNCNFIEDHDKNQRSTLYCFQCEKYLCESCLKNIHDKNSKMRGHSKVKQKIKNDYFCRINGHEEYKLDRYCTKCNKYLCPKCRCDHQVSDIFNFENQENKIQEIKQNLDKCENIIKVQKEYLNNYKKKIQSKLQVLDNLFKDYKNRNLEAISIYRLLIDNFEQLSKKIKNFNIYNNIKINDSFNLKEPTLNENECLISHYNKLSAFYMNINHIKTNEYTNYYITEKICNEKIKKCIIVNNNVIAYIYERGLTHISFAFRLNENSSYSKEDIFFKDFIKDIYPLNRDKFIVLLNSNNLYIEKISIRGNSLSLSRFKSFENINYYLLDLFMIVNNNSFFYLIYCSGKNYEKLSLISKENKKFKIKNIFDTTKTIIDNSDVDKKDKVILKSIFKYNGEGDEKIEKLIDVNEGLLQFFDKKNKDLYDKMRNKINKNEEKYMLNSNYIFKTFERLKQNINDNNGLNEEEKKNIRYISNLNNVCGIIIERYINYYVFNSKINNVYNYKNDFIFFIGEKYLINAYSLKEKQFYVLPFLNFLIEKKNFNGFEIIQISSDKIVLNDSYNKKIYFIEKNQTYDFCLLKKSFNNNYNVSGDKNYLLFDTNVFLKQMMTHTFYY